MPTTTTAAAQPMCDDALGGCSSIWAGGFCIWARGSVWGCCIWTGSSSSIWASSSSSSSVWGCSVRGCSLSCRGLLMQRVRRRCVWPCECSSSGRNLCICHLYSGKPSIFAQFELRAQRPTAQRPTVQRPTAQRPTVQLPLRCSKPRPVSQLSHLEDGRVLSSLPCLLCLR